MAAESRKVPLEIFFNPTILSDDNLFSEVSIFFLTNKEGKVKLSIYHRGV
jgi:hypothetical protein